MEPQTTQDLEIIRISTAGSVDDGKSTLLGRLLYDTKSIFEDQYDALKRASEHRGEAEVNLALLTDGLRAEREQGITIDVAYRYFATPKKRFIVADTPGHRQYTRNMITGASTADASLILIDARNGITDQSKRHAFITSLLRVPQVVIVINKMDLVGFSEDVFTAIRQAFTEYSSKLSLPKLHFIPVSALLGDNVAERSQNMPWYQGPSVLEFLESLSSEGRRGPTDLRLPVQYVVRPNQDFRGYMGMVASGTIRIGEEIVTLPSGQRAYITDLFNLDGPTLQASAGTNVLFTLDRQVDVSRGDMVVRPRNMPSMTQAFEAVVCWMSAEHSVIGKPYVLRQTTRETSATLEDVVYRFDVDTLHRDESHRLEMNDVGRIVVTTGRPLFLDTFEHNRAMGSFLLIDPVGNNVVAAGMITRATRGDQFAGTKRTERVLWLTGLSGAGKSTIADALVEQLKLDGIQAARLDGDDLRTGLNCDLGFSPEDRSENLRRAAHVAGLIARLGHVTVCSFITPLNSDRRMIRNILGDLYTEVYVKTGLAECERRDPKGHYRRARSGQLPGFTGVSAPFEEPDNSDIVVDTEELSVEGAVKALADFIEQ
ncbi:MAG: adenylyl-sulfate kinase [Fimbriimonas sp.]|nr:adenylyl-sulfate kinase [Fimbriimonas sp.]